MNFGPFPQGRCFRIENCDAYRKIQGSGIKVVEFLWLRDDQQERPVLWVVEAKSSSPRPGNAQDFSQFIDEIREKWVNALSMVVAACLQRAQSAAAELPDPFKTLKLSVTDFRFILVVNGHQLTWLTPLRTHLPKRSLPRSRHGEYRPPRWSC